VNKHKRQCSYCGTTDTGLFYIYPQEKDRWLGKLACSECRPGAERERSELLTQRQTERERRHDPVRSR